MKCTHCGSQWNSNTTVTVCPFCHKPLNTAPNGPKTLTSTLVQIRDQLGVETLGKGNALLSSFKDIAPELKREGVMLSYLVKYDGVKTLYEAKDKSNSEQQYAVSKVVCALKDNFVDESASETFCKTYMQVLAGKEKEASASDNDAQVTDVQRKLIKQLKESIPAPTAAPAPKPVAPAPKPVAPAPKPVAPAPKPVAPAPKPVATVATGTPDFQIDANGRLIKYIGRESVVNVPANVRIIGAKAFERNQIIQDVRLPEGLLRIEREAFAVCPKLRNVTFPSSLEYIGEQAFWACNALSEVRLSGRIKTIAPLAFWACKGLNLLVLRYGITELGENAFNFCTALKEIHLPDSLRTVHPNAFSGANHARVWGNNAWIVKDGHVVSNTNADTTYRNEGSNQKTVISPAANQTRAEGSKATNPQAYQNEQPPKPPVTPPKSSVTPPKSPVTPKAAPTAEPTKKESFIVRLLGASMYLTWGAALIMFFKGVEATHPDGAFEIVLPVALVAFLLGRVLFHKKRVFWGLFLSFCAAGNLIQFYEVSSDTTINNIFIIAYPILCAFTSYCTDPILKRFKK